MHHKTEEFSFSRPSGKSIILLRDSVKASVCIDPWGQNKIGVLAPRGIDMAAAIQDECVSVT